MTLKETALTAWNTMCDETKPISDRLDAWQTFEDTRKALKIGAAKLTGEDQTYLDEVLESLRALRDEMGDLSAADTSIAEIMKANEEAVDNMPDPAIVDADPLEEKAPKNTRGLITAAVKKLLVNTDMSYSEIEAAVKAEFPEALTTTRSIASTASEMRKAGLPVSVRRIAKVAK